MYLYNILYIKKVFWQLGFSNLVVEKKWGIWKQLVHYFPFTFYNLPLPAKTTVYKELMQFNGNNPGNIIT